jgi:hypothetical protein
MTKKEMSEAITNRLKETGKAVCVKDFGYELRSGFGAMKAYEIKYQRETIDGLQTGALYCYPWAGANVMWRTDFFRLNKPQIQTIYDRVCKAD